LRLRELLEQRRLALFELAERDEALLDRRDAFLPRIAGLVAPVARDERRAGAGLEEGDDGSGLFGWIVELGFEPEEDRFDGHGSGAAAGPRGTAETGNVTPPLPAASRVVRRRGFP